MISISQENKKRKISNPGISVNPSEGFVNVASNGRPQTVGLKRSLQLPNRSLQFL